MKQRNIYKPFEHWIVNRNCWIISDPHFCDKDVRYFRENSPTDDEIVKLINSKVSRHDTLIILGDIGNIDYVKKLHGYKILIAGNHDKGMSNYSEVFNEVYSGPLFINDKLILSHEPINLPFAFNIHGHTHALPHKYDDTHLNMCIEAINYTPISLISLLDNGLLKNVDSIHRITIDEATERKYVKND